MDGNETMVNIMKSFTLNAVFLIVMGLLPSQVSAHVYPIDNGVKKAEPISGEIPIIFKAQSGEMVEAFEGSLNVAENRKVKNSRLLTLKYVRFPATGKDKGIPIIYLAGGPGGSGIETAKYNRFPLFMAMREFGDVIAFDQRGTGASNDLPNCVSSQHISNTESISDAKYFDIQRIAFQECLKFWAESSIDVYGYTTSESVSDLDDLRKHLGASKINLWGISYGSHLSLAALKQMDALINRVVITAIEGLDQTVKQPARGDLYFDRLQAAINNDGNAKKKFPDVKALIRKILAGLEREPLKLAIPTKDGETIPYLLQRRDMQRFTSGLIADPARAVLILNIYKAIDAGDIKTVESFFQRAVNPLDTAVSFRPMTYLMDIASGSGEQRRAMIKKQAETALLGLHMNFSMHLETVDPSLDLGAEFRKAPISDVPTLLLIGTLDGRTYPQSAIEATAGLKNRQIVTVVNGGHNLFMLSSMITETIENFMRDKIVDGKQIIIDLPQY